MDDSTRRGLKIGRYLAEAGGLVFRAPAARDEDGRWDYTGGHNGTGYLLPRGWAKTRPGTHAIDAWQPGDALCLVTGVVVDVLDLDTYKGLDDIRTLGAGELPRHYGLASTPSGGRHHLIAPLGVGSRNGVLLGVDVKSGRPDGTGRGFVFLPPTLKVSRVTGAVEPYAWLEEPDLEDLLILGTDPTGGHLRELVELPRAVVATGYEGPDYSHLPARHRVRAEEELERQLDGWRARLAGVEDWPEGQTDEHGRGWEALSRDLAWALARLSVTPWVPEFDAEGAYLDLLPDALAANRKCVGKWTDALVERASGEPASAPPWETRPDAADDFGTPPPGGDLFDATPMLAHIRQAARARRVAPLTLLGYVLARVAVELPPEVVLPPLVGSAASLNIAFGMVGASGAGKSVTESTCDDLMGRTLPPGWLLGPGSGEGLVEAFLVEAQELNPATGQTRKVRKLDPVPHRLLYADEIRHLDKVQGRAGESMAPLLRTALTGGHLITTNASADRRREVPKMRYRLVAVAGIQPDAADALFRYTSEGTPQRWVWLPTDDAGAPDQPPPWPGVLDWDPGLFGEFGEQEVTLPAEVAQEVDANRLARLRTGAENVDGHWMITKEKVAVLLAALHGTLEVSSLFWDLAGELMATSDTEREACWKLYRSAGEREAVARRRAEVRADEAVTDEQLDRAVKSALEHLRGKAAEWVAWRALPRVTRKPGLSADEVVGELEAQAGVEVERGEYHGQPTIRLRWVG